MAIFAMFGTNDHTDIDVLYDVKTKTICLPIRLTTNDTSPVYQLTCNPEVTGEFRFTSAKESKYSKTLSRKQKMYVLPRLHTMVHRIRKDLLFSQGSVISISRVLSKGYELAYEVDKENTDE